MASRDRIRVGAVADLHCGRAAQPALGPTLTQINAEVDVLVLCGDLTDHGLPEEAQTLVRELNAAIRVPMVAVLGNHDYHSGNEAELERILHKAGIFVLNGDPCEVLGIGFAGVKGFGGGFGRHTLEPWGEAGIKHFVREAVEETLKLEGALARLRTEHRIAVLHYAPIQETVEGEPPAIFPFLGSTRLEEPINRYSVTAVFHGHAHHGKAEGKTRANIPVYNVSLPLMRQTFPDRTPVRILELTVKGEIARDGTNGQPAEVSQVSSSS